MLFFVIFGGAGKWGQNATGCVYLQQDVSLYFGHNFITNNSKYEFLNLFEILI